MVAFCEDKENKCNVANAKQIDILVGNIKWILDTRINMFQNEKLVCAEDEMCTMIMKDMKYLMYNWGNENQALEKIDCKTNTDCIVKFGSYTECNKETNICNF